MTLRISASAAALMILSSPAIAQVTADEVWDDLQTLAAGSGAGVLSGSESRSGNILIVSDVTTSIDIPDPELDGTVRLLLGDISFIEQTDGTVAVVIPSDYTVTMEIDVDGEDASADMTVRHQDLQIIASGSAAATIFTVDATQAAFVIDAFDLGDDTPFPGTIEAAMTDLSGTYEITDPTAPSLPPEVVGQYSAAEIATSVVVDNVGAIAGAFRLALSSVQSRTTGNMFSLSGVTAMGPLMDMGLRGEKQFSYDGAAIEVTYEDFMAPIAGAIATGPGGSTTRLSGGTLDYTSFIAAVDIAVQSPFLPIPQANGRLERLETALMLPLQVSEDPRDFELGLNLIDLSLDDAIWSIFDPTAQLPRDPASLRLDASGQGNFLVDITDPNLDMTRLNMFPAQIHTLLLNSLVLSVAGAELSGTGDVEFDNSAGPTVPPEPVGEVNLTLQGSAKLLERLTAAGLLPDQQVIAAQLFLSLFATPGASPDTLSSTIEFLPGGGITANGARIR